MSSTWGNNIKISLFGESHGPAVGIIIDGLPAGQKIDDDKIKKEMYRRKPGKDKISSPRKEDDIPVILSGILNGYTTGSPICCVIKNNSAAPIDYDNIKNLLRPGHADYTAGVKYKGFNDHRGGGHFSGRLTAPIVFAGAICKQILEQKGIFIGGHIYSIGNVMDTEFNSCNVTPSLINSISKPGLLALIDQSISNKMIYEIEAAKSNNDSIGGIVECAVIGVEPGIGAPMFDGIESRISSIVFGMPAVKGIEFGSGFKCAGMLGSQHNDNFVYDNDRIITKTNNHGGILGGISSGMPIIFRVAVKPTPSISIAQETVNVLTMQKETLEIKGRHDPCIVPRVVPVVEAATAIAIMDILAADGKL